LASNKRLHYMFLAYQFRLSVSERLVA